MKSVYMKYRLTVGWPVLSYCPLLVYYYFSLTIHHTVWYKIKHCNQPSSLSTITCVCIISFVLVEPDFSQTDLFITGYKGERVSALHTASFAACISCKSQ